jgi:pimeloyl-ACP methyl ester carboxylesterase
MTTEIELSPGVIEYRDTGGSGPPLVMLHGFMMDASLWDGVIDRLGRRYRCVVPTLPLGAHRRAMRPDADLSLPSIAAMVAELLERLDLEDVTLVGNDTGGAIAQLLISRPAPRVGRVVLASCEAFDNLPAGLTGKALGLTGKLSPVLFGVFMQQLRLRPIRRSPIAFGWLTKRDDAATVRFIQPVLHQPEIRRDAVRALRAVGAEHDLLNQAAQRLSSWERPALVVWATEDRVMPPAHARRLVELLPEGTLQLIEDSYTLIALDQPVQFADRIDDFIQESRVA